MNGNRTGRLVGGRGIGGRGEGPKRWGGGRGRRVCLCVCVCMCVHVMNEEGNTIRCNASPVWK